VILWKFAGLVRIRIVLTIKTLKFTNVRKHNKQANIITLHFKKNISAEKKNVIISNVIIIYIKLLYNISTISITCQIDSFFLYNILYHIILYYILYIIYYIILYYIILYYIIL